MTPPTSPRTRAAPSWGRPDWPPPDRSELTAALDGDWATVGEGARHQGQGAGANPRRRAFRRRCRARHPRLGARADAHPRLSRARPFPRQPRSARPAAAARRGGARSAHLRLRRSRSRPADLSRQGARPRIRHHPPDRRHPAPHLLPDARRRIPAHLQRRAEGLDSGAHRGPRQGDHLHPRGQARHPQQAGRGRRLREILRREIHRHQALRPRRRRVDDPGAGADHQARRRARRAARSSSAWRIAAGSTCWRRSWASRTAPSSTNSRAARRRPTRSRAPAT